MPRSFTSIVPGFLISLLVLGGLVVASSQEPDTPFRTRLREQITARDFASKVAWVMDFEEACALAREQGKVVLAYTPSEVPTSGPSETLQNDVFLRPGFQDLTSQFIPYLHMSSGNLSGKLAPSTSGRLTILSAQGDQPYFLSEDQCKSVQGVQRALWIWELRAGIQARAETNVQELAEFENRWRGFSAEGWYEPSMAYTLQGGPPEIRQAGNYKIVGDLSAAFKSGTVVLYRPEKEKAAAATGMTGMGMSGMGAANSGPKDQVPGEVARAELVDGKFELTGKIDEIRPVYYYVLDGITHNGLRMAPIKGLSFILETGVYSMTMNANHKYRVHGSYLNNVVYGTWQTSEAYQDLQALIPYAFGSVAGESKAQAEARNALGMEVFSRLMDVETKARRRMALTHPNMLVRRLVIETTSYSGTWVLEAARGILAEDPGNDWARAQVESGEAYLAKRQREAQAGSVGGRYLPFAAASLAGPYVSLSETCKQNKYVLLEFWASWCGPCRQEIPHLKEAYAHYAAKGFEIFAYTLDDKQADWAKASEQEDLPWINTGMGRRSDPTLLYEVTGVPANYLIDTSSGLVIARNLRGDDLGDRLKELLGE